MSRQFNRQIALLIDKHVKLSMLDYQKTKPTKPYGWPGECSYYTDRNSAWLLLSLYFDKNGQDGFTIDVGWSTLKRYPELPMSPLPYSISECKAKGREEAIIRVGYILSKKDEWWFGYEGSAFYTENEKLVIDAVEKAKRALSEIEALLLV